MGRQEPSASCRIRKRWGDEEVGTDDEAVDENLGERADNQKGERQDEAQQDERLQLEDDGPALRRFRARIAWPEPSLQENTCEENEEDRDDWQGDEDDRQSAEGDEQRHVEGYVREYG